METKGINIPTNAEQQEKHATATAPPSDVNAKSGGSGATVADVNASEAQVEKEEKVSDQTNATKNTTEKKGAAATTASDRGNDGSAGNVKVLSKIGEIKKGKENHQINCKSQSIGGESDDRRINGCNRTIISNNAHSDSIDPLGESTRGEAVSCGDEKNAVSKTVLAEEESQQSRKESVGSAVTEGSDCSDSAKKSLGTLGNNGGNNEGNGKPPVPNFRLEGSGGDSSVTVGISSISSSTTASAFHSSSAGHCGSTGTGGSNSLDNGEHSSMQSSEEMRLSLVSWYSEPDDPSRLIEGCCSALTTYRKEEDGIVEEIVDEIKHHHHHHIHNLPDDDERTCESGSSMGHEAVSSSAANSSPACKSDSEEKENKTPECGNPEDKISNNIGVGADNHSSGREDAISLNNGTTFTKSELITPNSNLNSCNNHTNNYNNASGKNSSASLCLAKSNQSECQSKKEVSDGAVSTVVNKVRVNSDLSKSKHCSSDHSKTQRSSKPHAHVHSGDQKTCNNTGSVGGGGASSAGTHRSRCGRDGSISTECPRCSRRSKSGTTTPASQPSRTRTPANRRVVQSCKSSTEIKKPIKSILKHDSRGSGSGSDKQSSMDSLGSSGDTGGTGTPSGLQRGKLPSTLMTRSDSGARARFNFNDLHTSTPSCPPEDKAVAKLKRIEKYATLRVRKNVKPRPLDLSDSESNSANHQSGKVGVPGVPTDLMSKSMSYLEKSSSNRVHISSAQGHPYGESTSASSTLKRHGSLRVKKTSSPQWEPSGTRTSALRLQKMQQAKAKNSPGNSSGSGNSGSAHSGSGDSLHYLPHSANSTLASGSSGMTSIHLQNSNSTRLNSSISSASAKEKHMGAKIFSKLSSALGQTASSNQKRIKQERGVQTDTVAVVPDLGRVSVSPLPLPDSGQEQNAEQIKSLERLCNRYRNQCLKIQSDFEQAESRKVELQKQLEETQHESTEMIEFLQAEKSTLAESLTEVEVEAKKWKDEVEVLKNDYQSRCSSLVRLSEQHKQEALRSQALLHRMENQSTAALSQLSHQLSDGAQSIQQTRQRVTILTESLLKTYKVPSELLNASDANQPIKETDLSCSLLLPLITSLSTAFPIVPIDTVLITKSNSNTASASSSSGMTGIDDCSANSKPATEQSFPKQSASYSTMTESSSFQSLNQAILDREAAEKTGLDDIMRPFSLIEGMSPDTDQLSMKKEIVELNNAIAKLLNVVRVIVIHCDKKVSSVASSILQCLKSIDDDKVGNMAEIAQVRKSVEAWSEKGISSSSAAAAPGSSSGSSPPCKPAVTSTTTVGESSPNTFLVGNGHAHV